MKFLYFLCFSIGMATLLNETLAQDYFLLDDLARVRKIENCVDVGEFVVPYSCTDISIDNHGLLYLVEGSSSLFVLDPETEDIDTLSRENTGFGMNSLAHDANNDLFAMDGSGNVHKYDFDINEFQILFTLDIGSAGDIVFHKGKLLASTHGYLIEIDLENATYKIIMCLPETIYGLTNVFEDCDNQSILAFGANSRKVYQLDLDNEVIDTLCQIEVTGWNWNIYGAASKYEYLGSDCDYFPEISVSDCADVSPSSITSLSQKESEITIYPNPASDWLNIEGVVEIGFINIYDLSGRLLLEYEHQSAVDVSSLANGIYIYWNSKALIATS